MPFKISPTPGRSKETFSKATRPENFLRRLAFGMSFTAALANSATSIVGNLQHAEQLSVQALQGGDIQTRDVVDAVMNAEQSLQSAIAIRDKIVSAYLEVSRMAI